MKSRRNQNGAFAAELPAILWLLFVVVTFPLIDLAAIGMRYTFLLTTSREAVLAASRAKTFYADLSATDLSARNIASNTANYAASRFNGIALTSVTTRIIVTDLNTNVTTYYSTPLTAPADSANALYGFETTVVGQVDPLLTITNPFFGDVPGLTGPMTFSISSQKMCENIQGLNQ